MTEMIYLILINALNPALIHQSPPEPEQRGSTIIIFQCQLNYSPTHPKALFIQPAPGL